MTHLVALVAWYVLDPEAPSHLPVPDDGVAAQDADRGAMVYHRQLVLLHVATGHQRQYVAQALLRSGDMQAGKRDHGLADGYLSPLVTRNMSDSIEGDQTHQLLPLRHERVA